jgi:outer membrane protein assembly factor BamD (BamD/ComL family)
VGLLAVGCQKKPEKLLSEASELFRNKDLLGAEQKYQTVIERFPQSKEAQMAYLALAQCYASEKEFGLACEQLDKYIKLVGGPQTKEGFNALNLKLGIYFKGEGKPEKALTEALATSGTLRTAPEEARQSIQITVARLYQENKQEEKAAQLNRAIIEQWPTNSRIQMEALEGLVHAYNQKNPKRDIKKVVEIYRDYLDKHPQSPIKPAVLFKMGAYYKDELKEPKLANEAFDATEKELNARIEKALGADEKGGLMMQLASEQQLRGNAGGAKQTLESIIKKYPASRVMHAARMQMVGMAMQANNPDEAITILKQVIKENPNTPLASEAAQNIKDIQAQTKILLAEKAIEAKDPKRAIALLEEALKENPSNQLAGMASQGIQQIREMMKAKTTTNTLTTSGTQPKATVAPVNAVPAAASPAAAPAVASKAVKP